MLESILTRVDRLTVISEKEKAKIKKLLKESAESFKAVSEKVKKDNTQLAEFFYKKATQLKTESTDKNIEKSGKKSYLQAVKRMNRYSKSAIYDFNPDKLRELKKAYKTYIFGMTSFFILAGVYMSQIMAITALILAIPIVLSMLSLQKRGYTGLMLAFSAAPIPLLQGVMGLTYGLRAMEDQELVSKIAEVMGKSTSFVHGYLAFMVLLSAVELYLITRGLYLIYKHRYAFL